MYKYIYIYKYKYKYIYIYTYMYISDVIVINQFFDGLTWCRRSKSSWIPPASSLCRKRPRRTDVDGLCLIRRTYSDL